MNLFVSRLWMAALGAIVAAACGLACAWVFIVPIFQAPDEPQHLDYALTILAAGRLIRAADRPILPNGPAEVASPYVRYLIAETDARRVTFHAGQRMPPDYGTPAYYRALDALAPSGALHHVPTQNPGLVSLYPFGYYAVLAVWIAILAHLSSSLTFLFFGSRMLSVVLLGISLVLTFAVARELHCSRRFALILTALCAIFPLTSFVASAVQPDNFSLFLVSLAMYLGLKTRRPRQPFPLRLALGTTLAMLFVTKPQFFLCVAAPLLAMLAAELAVDRPKKLRWIRWALPLGLPILALAAVHFWVIWGSSLPAYPNFPNTAAFTRALAAGPAASVAYLFGDFGRAVADYYLGGVAARSFWGVFGWLDTPIQFGSPMLTLGIEVVEFVGTLTAICLLMVFLQRRTRRLWRLARRRSPGRAVRLMLHDPFLVAALLFNLFMLAFFAATDGTFYPQGRNWIPFLLPIWMMALRYGPSIFRGSIRGRYTAVVTALLLVYCLLGSFAALSTIENRFYGPPEGSLGGALQSGSKTIAIQLNDVRVRAKPIDRLS